MYTTHKDQKPFALGALAGAALIAWVGFGTFNWKPPARPRRVPNSRSALH
jgi:hypothetical protein